MQVQAVGHGWTKRSYECPSLAVAKKRRKPTQRHLRQKHRQVRFERLKRAYDFRLRRYNI